MAVNTGLTGDEAGSNRWKMGRMRKWEQKLISGPRLLITHETPVQINTCEKLGDLIIASLPSVFGDTLLYRWVHHIRTTFIRCSIHQVTFL